MRDQARNETEVIALNFIRKHKTDCVGKIVTEDQLAVALLYIDMEKRGLLQSAPSKDGPVYSITPKGLRHLIQNTRVLS